MMQRTFTVDVEFSSYEVVRPRPGDLRFIGQAYGLGFLRDLAGDIERQNGWRTQNVRQYVYEILKGRSFPITDPKQGQTLRLSATYTFTDFQTIFFFFTENSAVGIVASDLAAGFPLSSIILFDEKLIIHLTESFWGLREEHFTALAANGAETIHEVAADAGPCLLCGDANFAHHAWNELSALQEIAAAGLDRGTSLAVFHEPLGPVNDVLGSRFEIVSKLPRARLPEISGKGQLTFCATGILIKRQLVDNIVSFAERQLSPYATEVRDTVAAHGKSSLWVSVRTRNRTIAAQNKVLTDIILRYLRDRADRMVIIDGHSLPFDDDVDAPWVRELNQSIVHDDSLAADEIISAVRTALPEATIVKFVGQKILESIAVGRHAGYYFAHHGTVQHKLGWFSPIRGIVHCNREVLQIMPDQWVKQQSELAALPVYVPIDLIAEDGDGAELGEVEKHLHHTNYRIADVDRAARIVSEFAEAVERPT